MTGLVKLSLSEQLEGLKRKSFSSKELTEAFLKEKTLSLICMVAQMGIHPKMGLN